MCDSYTQWINRRTKITSDPSKFIKRELDELGDAIKVVKEAEEFVPITMAALLLAAMRRKFQVLIDAGHHVPPSHQKIANRKHSIELSEAGNDIEWSESVVPQLVAVTDPADADWCIHKRPVWWATKRLFRFRE